MKPIKTLGEEFLKIILATLAYGFYLFMYNGKLFPQNEQMEKKITLVALIAVYSLVIIILKMIQNTIWYHKIFNKKLNRAIGLYLEFIITPEKKSESSKKREFKRTGEVNLIRIDFSNHKKGQLHITGKLFKRRNKENGSYVLKRTKTTLDAEVIFGGIGHNEHIYYYETIGNEKKGAGSIRFQNSISNGCYLEAIGFFADAEAGSKVHEFRWERIRKEEISIVLGKNWKAEDLDIEENQKKIIESRVDIQVNNIL